MHIWNAQGLLLSFKSKAPVLYKLFIEENSEYRVENSSNHAWVILTRDSGFDNMMQFKRKYDAKQGE